MHVAVFVLVEFRGRLPVSEDDKSTGGPRAAGSMGRALRVIQHDVTARIRRNEWRDQVSMLIEGRGGL